MTIQGMILDQETRRYFTIPESSGEWYAVLVKPGWIGRAALELYGLGFSVFAPKARKWVGHTRTTQCRVSEKYSVLGSYLFVRIDYPRQAFGTVNDVRGVAKIIPRPVPADEVAEFIKRHIEGEWDEVAEQKIPIGAKIRVMEGPNANAEAVLSGEAKGGKISYRIPGNRTAYNDYRMNVRPA